MSLTPTFRCSVVLTELQLPSVKAALPRRASSGQGKSGNNFWTFGNGDRNENVRSHILGTGMKIPFPIFGTGTGMEIPFPNFGNGNETMLFPGMIGKGNGNGIAKLSDFFPYPTF